ncbi:metallophosphoesterase [Ornithinimicrobium humiphilum]|uniref:Putative MPP superfamily phosphohydrolase n=1 Tax=Ornithinimicrobium humiphilum TaxID=125288 RepID=A0A543KKD0_9MICO|nr:metallophosphoesterase [Ornithinimicrobium humiphilum]TQM95504.1 putative MPP superfamily phosphohydrolase [Ornithinimicrobium humiphilum]
MTRPVWGVLGTGAALAAGAAAYATWVEPRWFALRRVEVPCLPPGASPLRVLHLSDLHLVPRQHRKREWVAGLAALHPDLVVTTGDNIAARDAVPALLEAYGELLDVPGAFVLGSNDYFPPRAKNPLRYLDDSHVKAERTTRPEPGQHGPGPADPRDPHRLPTEDLVAGLGRGGWLDLTNARGRLDVGGLRLELVGVDDPHLRYDDYASVAGPAAPDADLTVGVTHAPYQRVLDAMASDGAQLLIAGHTHGGQLQVPFVGALVTNCDLDTSRASGLSRWWPGAGSTPSSAAPPDAAWLHVSAGLGGNPYTPFRFCCRPEATLLTLLPAG